jgi:hypothetical protein
VRFLASLVEVLPGMPAKTRERLEQIKERGNR